MKLSIIIPSLNEADNIQQVLLALQYLRRLNHEIILIDAGSTDNTIDLASDLVDYIGHSEKGRAIQQNKGAQIASGNILLFLHADTFLADNFLTDIEHISLSDKYVWGRFDVKLSGENFGLRIIEFMMNLRSRVSGIATGDQAIFVKKAVFEHIQGFADLALMEDIDISSRLKKISRPFCSRLKLTTSSRRWEKNGLLKTVFSMWWYRLQFFFGVDTKKIQKQYYS